MFGPDYWLTIAAGVAFFAAIVLVVGLLAQWVEEHADVERELDVDEFLDDVA